MDISVFLIGVLGRRRDGRKGRVVRIGIKRFRVRCRDEMGRYGSEVGV